MRVLAAVAVVFGVMGLGASAARAEEGAMLITGAKVLAEEGDRWLEGQAVLVVDGRIARVAAGDEIDAPADARTIDASGLHLIPGMIDLHSHLLLHPYDETSWNDQVLKESLELRTIRGVTAARATLRAGFTTIRDLGTEGAGWADVALRDAVRQGIIEGPRILCATKALVATGCYGPSGFDPRWDVPKGAQVADGPDGCRKVVREQIAAGADWIKVYADYRRKPGDPSTPTYSQAELDAIVDEATSAGLPVASHAVTDEAIRRSVKAGVKTIEHGYEASIETLKLMREEGVVLCPTLTAGEAISRYRGWKEGEPDPARIIAARDLMKRALEAGVTIACGSDVGVFTHGENAREIELLAAYGMGAKDALAAATRVAARVIGAEDELGRIAEGLRADLVAVKGDPLADPAALREPAIVIKDGGLAVDRR